MEAGVVLGDAGTDRAMVAAIPLHIVEIRPVAAGNRLGRRPCARVDIETSAGPGCDREAVAAFLSALAPDLADEFRLARVDGADAGLPAALAALMVALVAEGRDLAAEVRPLRSGAPRRWRILVEDGISVPAAAVAELAADLLVRAIGRRPGDPVVPDPALADRLTRICGTATARFLHTERAIFARAIEARGYAWRARPPAPVGAVGEGRWRVRLRQVVSMRTAAPGALLAERKDAAAAHLARAGLPVPRQVAVGDAGHACAAAVALGYPVVVKPIDCSNARGVSVDLRTPDAVAAAFALARRHSPAIVVETQLPGEHFRLLVVRGRLVAAIHSAPARFVGDGRRSLRELVDEANRIPGRQRPRPMQRRIEWTDEILEYLAARGQGPDWVPPAGVPVALHWSGHGGRGGSAIAVTGPIHPDNRRAACQAADLVGLDIAGIDMILPDIGRSWRDAGGGICEVNRAPGLRYHMVAEGPDTPVLGHCLDHLLGPPGEPRVGRFRTIPILVFAGGAAMHGPALAAAAMLERNGLAVGMAVGRRYVAAGLPLTDPGEGTPWRVARLVEDPVVGAVVAVVPPAAILERGLGHGRADLAVVDASVSPDAAAAARLLAGLGAALAAPADLADGTVVARVLAERIAPPARSALAPAGTERP